MVTIADCFVCGRPSPQRPALAGLEQCERCAFVTYRERAPIDFSQLYGAAYFHGLSYPDYTGHEPSLRRSMRRHLEQMESFGPLRGSLLEIGCAYGFFLDESRRRFSRVVGVDISASAVQCARERFGLEAHAGDFIAMPFAEASFDVVCLWDTVEHLKSPHEYLAKARRVLVPGGRLFLTTGDLGSWNARLRGARWRQIHPPTHLHYFSRKTLEALLVRVGFEVLGVETAAYYHSVHNVLGTLIVRGGRPGVAARYALRAIGERRARRFGLWLNLGDIVFVAARPSPSGCVA